MKLRIHHWLIFIAVFAVGCDTLPPGGKGGAAFPPIPKPAKPERPANRLKRGDGKWPSRQWGQRYICEQCDYRFEWPVWNQMYPHRSDCPRCLGADTAVECDLDNNPTDTSILAGDYWRYNK